MRQFGCAICGCIVAVILYFLTKDVVDKEIVSWICVFAVLPFAGIGFVKYNGMPLEEFLVAFIKSEVLIPKELKFVSENMYYEAIKPSLENKQREELKRK